MDIEEKLIEEVRNRALLYDLAHPGYTNLRKKEYAWKDVAANVQLSVLECKKRWKGLRDSYKRCKRLQQIPSGTGSETIRKKWRYFDALSFLDNVKSSRCTLGNVWSEDEILGATDGDETDDILSPVLQPKTNIRAKKIKKSDSEKFQEFLDLAASSITDAYSVINQRQEQDSTALLFASLAAKIKESGMPPSLINSIELQVSNLVLGELKKLYDTITPT